MKLSPSLWGWVAEVGVLVAALEGVGDVGVLSVIGWREREVGGVGC